MEPSSRDSLGDPASSAAPAPAVHPPAQTTQPNPLHLPISGATPPAPSAGRPPPSRGADRGRTSPVSGTPGENFQSHILFHFHSLVSSSHLDPLCSSSPGDLWLTPPFLSPCFSPSCVESLINYFFCAKPERLRVSRVSQNIFKTQFAEPNIARYIAVWGPWQMSGFGFGFHTSEEAAMAAEAKIQAREPLPVREPPARGSRCPTTKSKRVKWKVPAITAGAGLLQIGRAHV